MSRERFTLIDEQRPHEIVADVSDGAVRIDGATIADTLGWKLQANGLCRGTVCIPVEAGAGLATGAGLDLAELARRLGRPLVLDAAERVAALAAPAAERTAALAALEAPDFTLPDLDGRLHSLSDHRGKKVLLLAYASW